MEIISDFIKEQKLSNDYRFNCVDYWLPLATQLQKIIATKTVHGNQKPIVLGINGCQGSGKSTLAKFLEAALKNTDLNTATLSLDDFYLSPEARVALAKKIHPLFRTRGVPGTHDVGLALRKFQDLLDITKTSVLLPRFDKALDKPAQENVWPIAPRPLDLIILEGWFVGAQPQPDNDLIAPVNDLEKNKDPETIWRTHANQFLAQEYQLLFSKIDILIMLRAPNFQSVSTWRNNQEKKLRRTVEFTAKHEKKIMSEREVKDFIKYFERLTLHCLKTIPLQADMIFDLDHTQRVIKKSGHLSLG
ncbi:MAG: P-loop NTPase fold protein [Gammaproteobacteria bacterium]|nr:P-loop NTPase fold protein [Gammaproteobacteria bacterium]